MYLAGLFLATGASLALAIAPAAAAGIHCKKHYGAAAAHATGHASAYGHRSSVAGGNWYPVPVVGYPVGGYLSGGYLGGGGLGCNTSIAQRNTQIGLINVNGIDSDNGGCVGW
jgi:hypothetical protein